MNKVLLIAFTERPIFLFHFSNKILTQVFWPLASTDNYIFYFFVLVKNLQIMYSSSLHHLNLIDCAASAITWLSDSNPEVLEFPL